MNARLVDPDKINLEKYSDNLNTEKNLKILEMPGTAVHVLSILRDSETGHEKIYDLDMRPGNDFSKKQIEESFLLDVDSYFQRKQLIAKGDKKGAEEIVFSSEYFDEIAKEAAKQKIKVDSSSLPYHRTLGAAGLGNTINTAYEVVRRVNYLTVVTSPMYNMANFNAKNVTNVIGVTNLNLKGFYKNALPTGNPEIGDNVTPDISKLQYTPFEKSIYADSFRYEFSMREVSDSVFSLEAQVQADIPGVFAKMEDDKITTLLNALSSSGTISPKWNATSGNFYTADAAGDVETGEVALDIYGSGDCIILNRDTMRYYLRNIQAAIDTKAPPSLQKPDSVRTGTMPRNPNLTYFVNNTITSKSFVVVAKYAWSDFYQGPKVNVSYKNQMTPGQVEGRILLSFNGVRQKIAAAAQQYLAVV